MEPEPTQHSKPTFVWVYIVADTRVATFNPTCMPRLIATVYKSFLFSAAGTFDSVGRGIITAFTNGVSEKYCHFDLCVDPAAWPNFFIV